MIPSRLASIVSATLVATALGACTTAVDPSDTVPVDAPSHVTLAAPFAFTAEMGGMCTLHVRYTLSAGVFVARFRNAEGTFFQGPPGALETLLLDNSCNKVPDHQGLKIDAGVFIPNNAADPTKIYYTQPQHGNYDFTVTKLAFGTDDQGKPGAVGGVSVTTNSLSAGAVAGAGISTGIVNGFIVADHGKIRFLTGQTNTGLRDALSHD